MTDQKYKKDLSILRRKVMEIISKTKKFYGGYVPKDARDRMFEQINLKSKDLEEKYPDKPKIVFFDTSK